MSTEWSLVALSAFLFVMQLVAAYRNDPFNVFGYYAAIMGVAVIGVTVGLWA